MDKVYAYIDGASRNNQDKDKRIGAWGAVLKYKEKVKKIGDIVPGATNNQMELTSLLEAIKSIKSGYNIEIQTDSKYVADGYNVNLSNWESNGWRTTAKKDVANREIWEEISARRNNFITVTQVPREKNQEADALVNQILNNGGLNGR